MANRLQDESAVNLKSDLNYGVAHVLGITLQGDFLRVQTKSTELAEVDLRAQTGLEV